MWLFEQAIALNKQNILGFAREAGGHAFLDLGCDDGVWTLEVARAAGAQSTSGVEIVEERASIAAANGVVVTTADMARAIPLPGAAYDLVHANQVIEHVPDVDLFASEVFRLLRPGGTAVISTENASAWHNVFAAAMGWQIFSLTNVSAKVGGIGNPLALHRGETHAYASWTHKVIFSHRGLKEFFEAHGFEDVMIAGSGYYPLPAFVGKLDPRHAHLITIRARKP